MLSKHRLGALLLLLGSLYGACVCADPGPFSSPAFVVAVRGDRLTVRLERIPLSRVLAELRRQAGIESEFIGSIADDTVWEAFTDLPLEEAIFRLLNRRSFVISYDTGAARPQSMHLVILPRGGDAVPAFPATALLQPVATTPTGPSPAARTADPAARVATSEQQDSSHAAMTMDSITQAMLDPDERVRARAQEMFDQALVARATQSAAGTPQPRQ